jgi:dipeptide/tripeptide permease
MKQAATLSLLTTCFISVSSLACSSTLKMEKMFSFKMSVYFKWTIIFFYLACDAIGTAATPGLFCQPRVIMKMIVETQIECRLAGETEVLGENLPQRHFCPSQNPT